MIGRGRSVAAGGPPVGVGGGEAGSARLDWADSHPARMGIRP